MHYSYAKRRYVQVKSTKNNKSGGIHPIDLRLDETYDEVLEKGIRRFAPTGRTSFGRIKDMVTKLGSSKGEVIPHEGFSLATFVEDCQTQKLRIYVLTKVQVLYISLCCY